jgi:hypothetical protein
VLYEFSSQCRLLSPKTVYLKSNKNSSSTSKQQSSKSAFPLYLCGLLYPCPPLNDINVNTTNINNIKYPYYANIANFQNNQQHEKNLHTQTVLLLNHMSTQQPKSYSNDNQNTIRYINNNNILTNNSISMDLNIIAWVDILHRTTCIYEIAYVIKISIIFHDPNNNNSYYINNWCIVRSGQEIDAVLTLLELYDKQFPNNNIVNNNIIQTNNNNIQSNTISSKVLVEVIPKQHETMTSQVQKLLCYRLRKCLLNKNLYESIEFQKIISEFILKPNIYDNWFLSGGIMQLYPISVINNIFLPISNNNNNSNSGIIIASVACALWDDEWREEVAVFTNDALCFYTPIALANNNNNIPVESWEYYNYHVPAGGNRPC